MLTLVYHVALLGDYRPIIERQIKAIIDSGLIEELDSIYVNILGEGLLDFPKVFRDKIKAVRYNIDLIEFETPSINTVRSLADINIKSQILYLNTRGVSHTGDKRYFIDKWSELKEYFLIYNYKKCLDVLETKDTCSVLEFQLPVPHYSGNMWWANTNYIKTLPFLTKETTAYRTWKCSLEGDEHIHGISRHDSEFWILRNRDVNSACLYNLPDSRICLYNEEIPKETYSIFNKLK